MPKNLMKIILKLVLVIIALFVISCGRGSGVTVNIINDSGVNIKHLSITVAEETKSIENLGNGQSETIIFKKITDSDYALKGTMENGIPIEGRYGYVTGGMKFEATFIIKNNGSIEFNEKH